MQCGAVVVEAKEKGKKKFVLFLLLCSLFSASSVCPMVPKTGLSRPYVAVRTTAVRTVATRAVSCPQTLTLFSLPEIADAELVSEVHHH